MSLQAIPGYEPAGYGQYGDDTPPAAADPAAAPPAQAVPSQTPPFVMPAPTAVTPLPIPPVPTTDPSAQTRAGVAIVIAGAGVGAGALLGGLWGAGSGLLFSGALLNAWRARTLWSSPVPTDRSEAIKTTVMSVVGIAAGGYLGYRAHQSKKDE
jgi:hypothetical protein